MPHRLRSHLSYANIIATLALFVALGGSSYAAIALSKNSVLSKHIKDGQVKRADLGRSSVDSTRVANGTLVAEDFAAGQLQPGPQGPKGDPGSDGLQGPQGLPGANGSPDTANQVLDKLLTVDGTGSGLDADLLDGASSSAFQRRGTTTDCPAGQTIQAIDAAGDVTCVADATIESVPAARVFRSTAQAVNSGFFTALLFDSEAFDTDNLHSTSAQTGRLTASRPGTYLIDATVSWPFAAGTYRHLVIEKNGVQAMGNVTAPTSITTIQGISTVLRLNANDYVELVAHHDAGATVNVNADDPNTAFSMVWLGP